MGVSFTTETQTFIGWEVSGIDAVGSREEDGKILCLESMAVIRFKLLMGLLFGPAITSAVLLELAKNRRPSYLGLGVMEFFSLLAWYAIYQALFRRRRIVFDPSTASVELFVGRTSVKRLARGDIAALDLSAVERVMMGSHGGTVRWTAYLVVARLKSGAEIPLFESSKEETVRRLHERLRTAFF